MKNFEIKKMYSYVSELDDIISEGNKNDYIEFRNTYDDDLYGEILENILDKAGYNTHTKVSDDGLMQLCFSKR